MTGAAAASGPTMALVAVEQRSPPGPAYSPRRTGWLDAAWWPGLVSGDS